MGSRWSPDVLRPLWQLLLSFPRVIMFRFPLQPHNNNITSHRMNNLTFHSVLLQSWTKLLERWLIWRRPPPPFQCCEERRETMTHIRADVRSSDPKCQINIERGKGGCWIFFLNLNVKQGVVRCAFQLLLSLIVDQRWLCYTNYQYLSHFFFTLLLPGSRSTFSQSYKIGRMYFSNLQLKGLIAS